MLAYIIVAENELSAPTDWPATGKRRRTLVDYGFIAVAAAAAPAHGFIVGDGGVVVSGMGVVNRTAAGNGMRTFRAACAWAFMLAAGSMVYQHFLGKWEASGLPVLPIAALGAMGGNPVMPHSGPGLRHSPGQSIPLGPAPSYQGHHTQQGGHQEFQSKSMMDQYDC